MIRTTKTTSTWQGYRPAATRQAWPTPVLLLKPASTASDWLFFRHGLAIVFIWTR